MTFWFSRFRLPFVHQNDLILITQIPSSLFFFNQTKQITRNITVYESKVYKRSDPVCVCVLMLSRCGNVQWVNKIIQALIDITWCFEIQCFSFHTLWCDVDVYPYFIYYCILLCESLIRCVCTCVCAANSIQWSVM